MPQNPYFEMSVEELKIIYIDFCRSRAEGKRCESFVPYAKELKENLGNVVTLKDTIKMAKEEFFLTIAEKFFSNF